MTGAMAGSAIFALREERGNTMAGVMAGSAIMDARSAQQMDTVTITINNVCNLQCPKCYLQYDGVRETISPSTRAAIYLAAEKKQFRHLAIIGKEPTLHPDIVSEMVDEMAMRGMTASIITNGLLLSKISLHTREQLSYIDVSLDGGPRTYERMRGKPYESVRQLRQQPAPVRVLHTIEQRNLASIDDMLDAADDIGAQYTLFSPYLVSKNDGLNSATAVPLAQMMRVFGQHEQFMLTQNAYLLLSSLTLQQEGISVAAAEQLINAAGLHEKVNTHWTNPIVRGFIRVNYDGKVMTPVDGLHPRDWGLHHKSIHSAPLDDIYRELRKQAV